MFPAKVALSNIAQIIKPIKNDAEIVNGKKIPLQPEEMPFLVKQVLLFVAVSCKLYRDTTGKSLATQKDIIDILNARGANLSHNFFSRMNVTPTQYIAKELFQQPEMLLKYKGHKDGALGIAIKNLVYQAGKYDVFVDIFGGSGAASAAVAENKDADYVYNEKNISSFNIQKNIRYDIQHVNSENYNAMKCHYLLTQIADILLQLYEKGSPGLREAKKTIKNISSGLLKSFGKTLTPEDILFIETHGYVKAVV